MNLIGAKVYYDGSHWIAIPHTERPYKRKRRKRKADKDETVEQFEKAFKKTAKGKKAKKKEKLLKEFAPLFESETEASEFVETQFERLNRNRIERYKRLKRKAYLQQWHYFCTFTYSDEKHTEETFRKQLMNCLYHLASRNGWRYIGAWERGNKTERLHFHALIYVPPNSMVGELEEHNDFNFKTHNRQVTNQNTFFNERFGRSDFNAISHQSEVEDSVYYMLKYITKNDERVVYSKGLKSYIIADILDEDIVCPYATAIHKKTLKDNGVKVLSAMENIPDTPEGIILESLLEGMNQYYSAELSQKVKRGMKETRLKGFYQGGGVPYGYKIDGRKLVIDEERAENVRFMFDEFSKGVIVKDIIKELTAMGKTYRGKPFAMNTVYGILRNEKYIGIYRINDEVLTNMYPQIVDEKIYNRVIAILERNKRGSRSAEINYLLKHNVVYANGHTKSKLELKRTNQCKSKSRDSLWNLDFLSTHLER